MRPRFTVHILLLFTITVLLFVLNLFVGPVKISILNFDADTADVFFKIRFPKSVTALLIGASLALSGTLMQTLFRNPLAGPYVLGVSSGASLFVAIAVIFVNVVGFGGYYFAGRTIMSVAAVCGSLLITLIILFISKRSSSNITVLLVGIMLAQIFGALQALVEYLASVENLKSFVVWGMGSVSNTTNEDLFIIVPVCLAFLVASLFLSRSLNALLLSESYARNLGVNVDRLRIVIILITAALTGISTAFCGPIAFVGLSVPIGSRLLFRSSHQLHQMMYCIFLGASALLLCDSICQLMSASILLPINTITTIVGTPFVIYLIFKSKTLN